MIELERTLKFNNLPEQAQTCLKGYDLVQKEFQLAGMNFQDEAHLDTLTLAVQTYIEKIVSDRFHAAKHPLNDTLELNKQVDRILEKPALLRETLNENHTLFINMLQDAISNMVNTHRVAQEYAKKVRRLQGGDPTWVARAEAIASTIHRG